MVSYDFPGDNHAGMIYYDFLSILSKKRDTQRYLEIGVSQGLMMGRIATRTAVGVDPGFQINTNIVENKTQVTLINASSDRFFANAEMVGALGGPPDLVFLDGYHTFEFLLRDFINSERICADNSLIAMHDCLPLDAVMTERYLAEWGKKTPGSRHYGAWTGDVWKIVPLLTKYRPDLRIVCANCGPTGLVLISNLDPASEVLRNSYLSIVREYRDVANDEDSIRRNLYDAIELVDPASILNENDHTLFFRI